MIRIYINGKYWGEVPRERASMMASFLKHHGWRVKEFPEEVYIGKKK